MYQPLSQECEYPALNPTNSIILENLPPKAPPTKPPFSLLLTAIIVLVVLYFKRQRRDDREDLEERQRDSGFYGNYATQRFGAQGPRKAQATESRRSSGESFFDYKQDHGPYHLAQFQSPEVSKPPAARVVS